MGSVPQRIEPAASSGVLGDDEALDVPDAPTQTAAADEKQAHGATQLRRFERLTRWSLYLSLGLVAASFGVTLLRAPTLAQVAGGLGAVGHALAGALLTRAYVDGHRVRTAAEVGYAGWGLALSVLAILVTPRAQIGANGILAVVAGFMLSAVTACVLALRHGWLVVAVVSLAAGIVTTPAYAVQVRSTGALAVFVGTQVVLTAVLAAVGRMTRWTLDAARALAASQATHARLAVAEERLRFARDLHDVYGRTLATVAVRSELAAELTSADPVRARAEMRAVRELAEQTLGSLRSLVSGYRSIDLATEVGGARAVLAAAGVTVEVTGLEAVLPLLGGAEREALAWTVREASTNVLRHGGTERAVVQFTCSPAGSMDRCVRLRVENDVPPDRAPRPGGAGLAGLRERLTAIGAELRTERLEGTFVLVAAVPCRVPPPEPATDTEAAAGRP